MELPSPVEVDRQRQGGHGDRGHTNTQGDMGHIEHRYDPHAKTGETWGQTHMGTRDTQTHRGGHGTHIGHTERHETHMEHRHTDMRHANP